jgi:hypothetical protein
VNVVGEEGFGFGGGVGLSVNCGCAEQEEEQFTNHQNTHHEDTSFGVTF